MFRYVVALATLFALMSRPARAQDPSRYQLVATGSPSAAPLGTDATVELQVHYRGGQVGRRLYLLPVAMDGDRGIVGGGTITVSGTQIQACGTFANAPDNPYGIAARHYPLGFSSTAARVLGLLGVSRDQVRSLTGEDPDAPVSLAMGFLAAVPATGDGVLEASFTLAPPRQERWYDGILLVPFEVTLEEGRDGCARFDSGRMNAVRIAVEPEGPRPVDSAAGPKRTEIGELEVTGVAPRGVSLVLGAPNRIAVTVDYRDVPAQSAVYVMLLAQRGDTIVRPDGGLFTSGAFNFSTCTLKPGAGYYGLATESQPLTTEMPYLLSLEAGRVGDVPAGGSGTVTGEIVFVPPPFQHRYDGIYLHPLLVWEEGGRMCTRRDVSVLKALRVPVSG